MDESSVDASQDISRRFYQGSDEVKLTSMLGGEFLTGLFSSAILKSGFLVVATWLAITTSPRSSRLFQFCFR